MSEFFLSLVNMSISAGWIVLVVLLLRLLLKKAPKWITVLLWGIVAVRLICPFTVESVMSLIPSAETISITENAPRPNFESGVSVIDTQVNEYLSSHYYEGVTRPEGNFAHLTEVFALVWIIGIAVMLLYTAISYFRLKRKIGTAVLLRDNIYQSENVISPFVLGVVRPKIYLPFQMCEGETKYVVAHEKAHIRRGDHLWKPLGFLLLSLHWFNPLMWLGYVLLCRDIELACDEKVIREFDVAQKADYSQALLTCSVNRRIIAACPLAFGEVGVKGRVKSVLNYKKPAFWIIVVAVLVCIIAAVCFLTDPASARLGRIEGSDLAEITFEQTSVMVSGLESYEYVGAVEREELLELYNLRVSRREISLSRSEERDKTNTMILNISGKHEEVMTSYVHGIYVHFNDDFSEVWLNDGVKPTLTYQVEEPERAKKIYEKIAGYSLSGVGGADAPSEVTETVDGYPFFYATVLEIYDGWILAEATKDSKLIKAGSQYFVSTRVKNPEIPVPEIQVGTKLAIVFNGEIQETYPSQINTVYAIYLASELASAIAPSTKTDADALVTLSAPPAMVVVSNEQSIEGQMGTSEWTYRDENGKSVTVASEGIHPLNAKKTMPCIDLLPSYASFADPLSAYLGFNVKGMNPIVQVPADEITIFCWNEEDWGKGGAKGEEISVNTINGTLFFDLKDGNYVYEVTAAWKKNEGYGGTARYTFYTAKSNLDWNSYPKIGEGSRAVKTFLQTEAELVSETYEKGDYVVSKTYHQMDDGLWVWQSYGYLYRLEITGKMPGAEKNNTYLVLSNRKDLAFDEVWKAEFSSNTEDFFNPREAVIVARKIFD